MGWQTTARPDSAPAMGAFHHGAHSRHSSAPTRAALVSAGVSRSCSNSSVVGYNAYSTTNHFPDTERHTGRRYQPGRADKRDGGGLDVKVPADSTNPADLAEFVDQFVVHYDVCGTSETCFRVLHDERHLSVQFMIDVDGTIFQTMDVREQAWHAAKANRRSVGVEIAHIGAYPPDNMSRIEQWYDEDPLGPHIAYDKIEGRLRTPGYIGRPARPELISGRIHGTELVQYDYTPEQYDSLVKLAAALCRALPGLEPDAPRDANGEVRTDALSPAEYDAFKGILGHNHVTTRKQDPGPAFDWERFLKDVRRELARP